MTGELRHIGARLRAVRRSRGLTLAELAASADMSTSTLSRLESGKRQASLELLIPLTRRLGIRLDDLVPQEREDPRVHRPTIRRNGMIIAPLAPEGSPIGTYKITYTLAQASPPLRAHDGYEWLYVLRGKLLLQLGDRTLTLHEGEAAEFDTHIPHAMSAAGGHPAQVISIFNETGARIHTHTSEQTA